MKGSLILIFGLILVIGESVAFFIFKLIELLLNKKWAMAFNRSVIKGILERIFLFLALVYHIPQALIAFGALKIATRFIEDENKISLDYFFIGNICSLLIALIYFVIWKLVVG
jgi:hypothetical protein